MRTQRVTIGFTAFCCDIGNIDTFCPRLVERLCEWGEEVSTNAIEVYVHRLRKKLETGGVRIVTVRGLGYCLEKPKSP